MVIYGDILPGYDEYGVLLGYEVGIYPILVALEQGDRACEEHVDMRGTQCADPCFLCFLAGFEVCGLKGINEGQLLSVGPVALLRSTCGGGEVAHA